MKSYSECSEEPKERLSPVSISNYIDLQFFLFEVTNVNPDHFNIKYENISAPEGEKLFNEIVALVDNYARQLLSDPSANIKEPFPACITENIANTVLSYDFLHKEVHTYLQFKVNDSKSDVIVGVKEDINPILNKLSGQR